MKYLFLIIMLPCLVTCNRPEPSVSSPLPLGVEDVLLEKIQYYLSDDILFLTPLVDSHEVNQAILFLEKSTFFQEAATQQGFLYSFVAVDTAYHVFEKGYVLPLKKRTQALAHGYVLVSETQKEELAFVSHTNVYKASKLLSETNVIYWHWYVISFFCMLLVYSSIKRAYREWPKGLSRYYFFVFLGSFFFWLVGYLIWQYDVQLLFVLLANVGLIILLTMTPTRKLFF